MRVLLVNLKQFYQNGGLWLYYALIGLFIGAMIWMRSSLDSPQRSWLLFGMQLFVTIPLSQIVAGMQLHIMDHPFAAILPNHRLAARRLVFVIGVAVSLLVSVALSGEGIPPDRLALALCSRFFATLAVFLIGAVLALVTGGVSISLTVISLFVLIHYWEPLSKSFDHIILSFPWVVIVLGSVVTAAAWFCLDRRFWRRRSDLEPDIDNSDVRDEAGNDQTGERKLSDTAHRSIDRLLLRAMAASEYTTVAKHVWSALYAGWLDWRQWWKLRAAITLAVVVWVGYDPSAWLIMLMMMLFMDDSHRSVFSLLLMTGGRRERFWATFVPLAVLGGLLSAGVALSIVAMNALMPLIPQLKVGRTTLAYHPVSLAWLMLVVMAFPAGSLADIWSRGRRDRRAVAMVIAVGWLVGVEWSASKTPMPLAVLAFSAVLSWLVCALGVHRIVMRSDLVRR